MVFETSFKTRLVGAVLCLAVLLGTARCAAACYTIVVGKDASASGCVIMAHNEDDSPPQIVNHHKVPRLQHAPGEKVRLPNGGELDQVPETWSYIWSEMPGMLYSDSYVNEWGVGIASDVCPSREDRPELSNGGITSSLRQLVAQRARTAREGVHIAGQLVERFGYVACGRTYIICDPDEGWMFCAVGGKHWLAKRVPDDEVAMVANTFSVRQVELGDTNRCLASADIVDYAVSRGWHNPAAGAPFDFAAAYADPHAAHDSSNFCRQWAGLQLVARDPIPLGTVLPFSVVPKHKLDVADVMQILRNHYEGTDLYRVAAHSGSPHQPGLNTICNEATQTSFVLQLRRDVPLEVGIVYWVCLAPPCVSCYLPFHFGMAGFPNGFCGSREQPAVDFYWWKVQEPFHSDPLEAFWTFSRFHYFVAKNYAPRIADVRLALDAVEKRAFALQQSSEQTAIALYSTDRAGAAATLADYSHNIYLSALEAMNKIASEKR